MHTWIRGWLERITVLNQTYPIPEPPWAEFEDALNDDLAGS